MGGGENTYRASIMGRSSVDAVWMCTLPLLCGRRHTAPIV